MTSYLNPTLIRNYAGQAEYKYSATAYDDSVLLTPLPSIPGTGIRYVFDFDAGEGNDRLSFFLSDANRTRYYVDVDYKGGAGVDTLELDFAGATSVNSAAAGPLNFKFYSYESLSGSGTFKIDNTIERFVIKGSDYRDIFIGGSGDDWFDGRGGLDFFSGSAGNDGYVLDKVGEKITGELVGGGTDSIWAAISIDLNENRNVENLRMTGTGDINGTGNALANLITGNAGNNVIAGGLGVDTLYGKGGKDTFVFDATGKGNRDSIFDFSSDDKISLVSSAFPGLHSAGGELDAAYFVRGSAATAAGHAAVVYDPTTGIVGYDPDGLGGVGTRDIVFIGKSLAFFDAGDILI